MTARIVPYRLPFVAPLTLGGRVHQAREGWLLRYEEDGAVRWGECAPLPGFSRESPAEALADLEKVVRCLNHGRPPAPVTSSARYALEMATGPEPEPFRPTQSLNGVLFGHEGPDQAASLEAQGYPCVKVKVSGDPSKAAARVVQIRDACTVPLRLDANRSWTQDEAMRFFEQTGTERIEYIEEPLTDSSGTASLVSQGIPVAWDESLRDLGDTPLPDGLAAIVVKPGIVGGFHQARHLIRQAEEKGTTVVISSALESSLGLRALARFAASLGAEDVPAGLGTARLFKTDVTMPAFPQGPTVEVADLDSFEVLA